MKVGQSVHFCAVCICVCVGVVFFPFVEVCKQLLHLNRSNESIWSFFLCWTIQNLVVFMHLTFYLFSRINVYIWSVNQMFAVFIQNRMFFLVKKNKHFLLTLDLCVRIINRTINRHLYFNNVIMFSLYYQYLSLILIFNIIFLIYLKSKIKYTFPPFYHFFH